MLGINFQIEYRRLNEAKFANFTKKGKCFFLLINLFNFSIADTILDESSQYT